MTNNFVRVRANGDKSTQETKMYVECFLAYTVLKTILERIVCPLFSSHQMLPNKHPFKSLSHCATESKTPELVAYVHITLGDSSVLRHLYLPLLRWSDVDGWALRRVNWEKKTTDVTVLHSLGLLQCSRPLCLLSKSCPLVLVRSVHDILHVMCIISVMKL